MELSLCSGPAGTGRFGGPRGRSFRRRRRAVSRVTAMGFGLKDQGLKLETQIQTTAPIGGKLNGQSPNGLAEPKTQAQPNKPVFFSGDLPEMLGFLLVSLHKKEATQKRHTHHAGGGGNGGAPALRVYRRDSDPSRFDSMRFVSPHSCRTQNRKLSGGSEG